MNWNPTCLNSVPLLTAINANTTKIIFAIKTNGVKNGIKPKIKRVISRFKNLLITSFECGCNVLAPNIQAAAVAITPKSNAPKIPKRSCFLVHTCLLYNNYAINALNNA